jgi:hypothetical protein
MRSTPPILTPSSREGNLSTSEFNSGKENDQVRSNRNLNTIDVLPDPPTVTQNPNSIKETIDSYRRAKNMLRDLSSKLKPKKYSN